MHTDAQLDAFARYELQLDAYMESHPFSAMCAYPDDLCGEDLMQISCVNALFSGEHAPFQLALGEGGVVSLRGEIDLSSHAALAKTLARIDELLDHEVVAVDLGELAFIDHRAVLLLDRCAARRGRRVQLRRVPGVVRRLVALLDVAHVAVESVR